MNDSVKVDRTSVQIKPGAFVIKEKTVYRITQIISFNEIIGTNIETGRAEKLLVKDCKAVQSENLDLYAHTLKDLGDVQDNGWKMIEERMEAILPIVKQLGKEAVDAAAEKAGVHYTTLYRWYRAYLESGNIMGLLPKKVGRREGDTQLDYFAESIIQDVIENFYLTKQRPTAQAVIRKVHARCHESGVKPPSKNTIRNRLTNLDEYTKLKRRYDKSSARDRFKPASGHFEATYPLEYVQIDHTKVDIILVDEEHRQPIGRPYITLAIDIFSRMIHGYYLSLEAPSATSVAMCIANAVTPKDTLLIEHGIDAEWNVWGFMDTVHVDNGADFRSEALTRACLTHNIKINYRPAGQSNFGGHVERVIGTMMKEIHALPGTTFSGIKERHKYDSDKEASMTFSELEKWILTYITKVYHKKEHSGIGMSPEEKYYQGIFGTPTQPGMGFPAKPSDPQSIVIDFLPAFGRTIQRNGINIDGLNYYDSVLRPYFHMTEPDTGKKKSFIVKRDPKDLSYVWFYDDLSRDYFKIPLGNASLPRMTLWEFQAIKRNLREKGTKGIDDRAIILAYEELHRQGEVAKKATRKKRRAQESKKVAVRQNTALEQKAPTPPIEFPMEEDDGLWDEDVPDFDVE